MRKLSWQTGVKILAVFLVGIALAGCPKKPSPIAGAGTGAEGVTRGSAGGAGGAGSATAGQGG